MFCNRSNSILPALALVVAIGCGTDPDYPEPRKKAPQPATRTATPPQVEPTVPVSTPASVTPTPVSTERTEPVEVIETVEVTPVSSDPHGDFVEAERLYVAGDRADAIPLLRGSIAARPEFVPATYLLGLSLWKTGENEEAETWLEKTLELAPDHTRARINLARVLLSQDRARDARAQLAPLVEEDLASSAMWNVRGRTFLAEKNWTEAEDCFARSVDLDMENVYALNNLGYTRIQMGDFAAAVEPLTIAVTLPNVPAYVYNNLGTALERIDDPIGAANAYASAVEGGHGSAGLALARVEPFAAEARALAETVVIESSSTEVAESTSIVEPDEPSIETASALEVETP